MSNEIPRLESEANIVDDRLVISLSIANLANAARQSDFFFQCAEEGSKLTITSEHDFAKSVANQLNDEDEDGSTLITRMFDQAFENAVNSGESGVIAEDD
jgi:hypothetical protein